MTTLEIDGATLTVNETGVILKSGWLFSQQISEADVVKIRDWLIAVFPIEKAKA